MAHSTNCPKCGRTNVKGKNVGRPVSVAGGALAGSLWGPVGTVIGAALGAASDAVAGKALGNVYKYKCPRCGATWEENE